MEKIKSIARDNGIEINYKLLYIDKVNGETRMSSMYVSESRAKKISEMDENKHFRILGFPDLCISATGEDNLVVFKE